MQVDTLIRLGEYYSGQDEWITAQETLDEARRRYEEAKGARFLSPEPELARVYARLGDVEYYVGGNLDRALTLYDRAAGDGFMSDDLAYKRGYIHYRNGRYDQAAEHFFTVGGSNPLAADRNVLYARGNTLYHRGNFFGGEAFYRELLNDLTRQRDRIENLLVRENPDHEALIEYMIKAENNLAIALYRQSQRDATEGDKFSESLALLESSAQRSENMARDFETGERAAGTNLAYLNMREILYPSSNFEPQIYEALPRDLDQRMF
jgi:tetratricopeptide (TPR) repeat protein